MHKPVDFFIVGAQKAGTTSLHKYLGNHPDIYMPDNKEINFFANDREYAKGFAALESQFRGYSGERLKGLSHVQLIYRPQAPRRLYEHNPQAKIVVILRNPIDRAYSAYWYARRNGVEPCETFELALGRDKTLGDNYFDQADFAYLDHGRYVEQLRRFAPYFSRENTYIILTEDLGEAEEFWPDFLAWLGVDTDVAALRLDKKHNVSSMPKNPTFQRLVKASDSKLKRVYKRVIPQRVRKIVTEKITEPLINRNLQPFEYPPMHDETRNTIRHYFQECNEELAEYIGRDLSGWK